MSIPLAGLAILTVMFWGSAFGFLFAAMCAGLAALWFVLIGLSSVDRLRRRQNWSRSREIFATDPIPTFGVNDQGDVMFDNSAARRQYNLTQGRLQLVLSRFVSDAPAFLEKLHANAARNGNALEDLVTPTGGVRVIVTPVGTDGFIWRIEGRVSAGPDESGLLQAFLPTMHVQPPQRILSMNSAMQDLLGGHIKALDRIVSKLPIDPSRPVELETADGTVSVRMAQVDLPDGTSHYYVWPDSIPGDTHARVDSIQVPLMRISPEGRIVLANERARNLLGLDEDANRDFGEVVEGLGRPISEWIKDVAEDRCSGRTEVVRAALPDQDVYLQVSLGRVVEQGEVSVLAVLIDATELKTLEARFVQSQKMQAIGQLAGGVAHDFNNLLTAITGYCDLLLLRHEAGDPNYGDLVQINQNANRAASLVGQLLAFSRKQNLKPERIDMRETISELTHLLKRLVGERINLEWRHDPKLPQVRADRRQLEQVFMNLVVNARDAMPDGGKIIIETTTMQSDAPIMRDRVELPPGDYVVVKVIDEGHGIAPDKLQKIFEPFFSTKKPGEGTGLGLSMAYGIVKQSGGFIFAESERGKGSTFTMLFPAHFGPTADEAPIARKKKKAIASQEGGHVLLVEDEAPVRAFASRALRLRGYTVTEAACAEDALSLLEDPALDVDIFVTDVVMPGLDGPTWVSKALETRPDVKVVFVSGYSEDSVRHNRQKIPNASFLPKPFSLSQLSEMVQKQIS